MTICDTCGRTWPEDRFNAEGSCPETCFACRSKGIRVGFQGGKEYFHEDTEKRRSERAIAEGKAAGFDPVPVHSASTSVSATALRTLPAISKSHGAFGKPVAPSSTAKVKVGS